MSDRSGLLGESLLSIPVAQVLELCLWLFLALAVSGRVILAMAYGTSFVDVLDFAYTTVLASALLALFPIVFRLIFGRLPLEALRAATIGARSITIQQVNVARQPPESGSGDRSHENSLVDADAPRSHPEPVSALQLLAGYAVHSRSLADGLYTRSGVYLLIGVMVAFLGVAFFYVRNFTGATQPTSDAMQRMFDLLPSFGVLFFIEFIAFFFFRQYRAAMEEFRYYEAIKRNREENVVLLRLVDQNGADEAFELVRSTNFYSQPARMIAGETTEILESRKLDTGELKVLEKVVEVVKSVKR